MGGSTAFPIQIGFPAETVDGADSTALAADAVAISVIAGNYDIEKAPKFAKRLVKQLND